MVTGVPGFTPYLFLDSSLDWGYKTLPEPSACKINKDNKCHCPRGKVMGGSSSINLMLHSRGVQNDYNEWAYLGNENWDYINILPYFQKLEGIHPDFKVIELFLKSTKYFFI